MTGSGSAVVGLFEEESAAQSAREWLAPLCQRGVCGPALRPRGALGAIGWPMNGVQNPAHTVTGNN